jgi:hypothetical protein
MKQIAPILLLALVVSAYVWAQTAPEAPKADADGFYSLFDGKSLAGWKVNQNPDSFKVVDGTIVTQGPTAHLFYEGPVKDHSFKNFHFKAEVMTWPKANSGIYFHTQFQEKGFPNTGYEAQVDNSHSDPIRTGSLYGVVKNLEPPAKDNEWFTYEIIVNGKKITTKVNGKTIVDYTEPADVDAMRKPPTGTFALQGHDPGSKVAFRNIMVKPLAD